MKKLLFSLILSLLPIASSAIQYEYFNPLMKSNAAVKVNETVGVLTPPEGKGFGVLSALTNMQSVASSIATNEYGIQVDTLGLVCPTEDAVAAAISTHNTDQSAHSYIQNRITVNDNAIAANADAIQKTREDFMAADTELQTQITSHAGELTTLRNDLDDLGDEVAVIEGKIPASTTSSNQLVNASQLTAESQDIRSEFAQADSELQQQINAHATAITNLEDSVDSINGKIPTNASATNLLVSTSQLNTEIQDVRADFMADDAALQTQINGQATAIAGIQDDITGINSKISTSASSTNKLVSASELSAAEQDIRADMNEADSQLQTQITAQAGSITTLRNDTDDLGDQVAVIEGKIPAAASSSNQLALNSQITSLQTNLTNGLALKLDKNQGSENANKVLTVGTDGQITLSSAPGSGLLSVSHDATLTGAGTDASPLSLSGIIDKVVKIRNGQGTGSLWIGADVNNNTLTNNQRHLARIVVPSFTNTERGATLLGWDSSGDTNVHITNNSADMVGFGGSKKITNATSPMGISFCVAKTRESTAAADKVYPLAMDANAANFDVPVDMPELTVGTDDGTLNLSITAGVATIATNNGLDIISQTKFDTLPTTDDTTTWANALDANLVSKAQVASALSELPTGASLPILMSVWSDHLLDNMSWLRADTFSWQSGDVYVAAYEHLVNDSGNLYAWASGAAIYYTLTETPAVGDNVYSSNEHDDPSQIESVDNGTITFDDPRSGVQKVATRDATGDSTPFVLGIGLKTDTIGDITITYYLAQDGHKICLPDQESNIVALYEATGVAWYYILDTENKQFKLPRTKYGFTGLRDSVGGYVAPGLPSIEHTHSATIKTINSWNGTYLAAGATQNGTTDRTFETDVNSTVSEIYGNSDTVQPPATQMYLYFYVGNFEQSAIEQTAGITAETLNGKADTDLGNIPTNYDYVVESQLPTSANGYTWYRKYKSGWVEQGGRLTMPATNAYSSSNVAITLPVPIQAPESAVLSYSGLNASENFANCENQAALSATTATIGRWNNGNSTAAARNYMWVLYGQAQ